NRVLRRDGIPLHRPGRHRPRRTPRCHGGRGPGCSRGTAVPRHRAGAARARSAVGARAGRGAPGALRAPASRRRARPALRARLPPLRNRQGWLGGIAASARQYRETLAGLKLDTKDETLLESLYPRCLLILYGHPEIFASASHLVHLLHPKARFSDPEARFVI